MPENPIRAGASTLYPQFPPPSRRSPELHGVQKRKGEAKGLLEGRESDKTGGMNTPCTGPNIRMIPEGEDRPRLVCGECGFIFYENPKLIVGAVCTWGDAYLLCRRAIEPRRGYWTIPAGFMELGETAEAGAIREVWEEAGARVVIDSLLGVYSISEINQVHLVYRARMETACFKAGVESLETRLFAWNDIPWEELTYPNVAWSLRHHRDLIGRRDFSPRGIPDGLALVRGRVVGDPDL